MLKVTVDCNQRLQLISKVEIFSNQWFRWSKKGASYGLMPPSLFLLRLCLLLLHKKRESESVSFLICIIFAEDKLHSAKYSSKLDILHSFALSLHMIINNFNNHIFNLKDNDETNYNNRMCNYADG